MWEKMYCRRRKRSSRRKLCCFVGNETAKLFLFYVESSNFYLLLATMLFGLISYFLVSPVSQIYQIELGIPSAIAVSTG